MMRADVLIASDSSFSLSAAILSSGLILGMEKWKRFALSARDGMRFSLGLRQDGSFDCTTGLQQWRVVPKFHLLNVHDTHVMWTEARVSL